MCFVSDVTLGDLPAEQIFGMMCSMPGCSGRVFWTVDRRVTCVDCGAISSPETGIPPIAITKPVSVQSLAAT